MNGNTCTCTRPTAWCDLHSAIPLTVTGREIGSFGEPDGAVAGLDYEPSGCPICGGTDSPKNHQACLDQLDVWPEPGYNDDI